MPALRNGRLDKGGIIQYNGCIVASDTDYTCQTKRLAVDAYWNPMSRNLELFKGAVVEGIGSHTYNFQVPDATSGTATKELELCGRSH
jgi:hypothetical protein